MKIGILGAGQLAKMLALSAAPMGIEVRCYSETPNCSAELVSQTTVAHYDDVEACQAFAHSVDLITFENENIPSPTLDTLEVICPILPNRETVKCTADRLSEKNLFSSLNIATTRFFEINTLVDCRQALTQLAYPAVLKTRRFGYDGKGQTVIHSEEDIVQAWESFPGQKLILEDFIDFEREVSQIAVRAKNGEIRFYPLTENTHIDGILRKSVPLQDDGDLSRQAQQITTTILEKFDYVGTLAIEFFVRDAKLIANEIAPRVHNSGHWTIEGATCSQFENHCRAILGLPLGDTSMNGYSAMYNLIGKIPNIIECLQISALKWHDYGKTPRAERKLGHVTIHHSDKNTFNELCAQCDALFMS